jgi:hypothetical protein
MVSNSDHSTETRDVMGGEYRMHGGKEQEVQSLVGKCEKKSIPYK